MKIETVKSLNDVDNVISFFEEVFSEFTNINDDTSARLKELMVSQFNEDSDYIMYIKDKNNIIAAIFSFYSKPTNQVTLSILGVSKKYQLNGLGSLLIDELTKRCKRKGISSIILNSKTSNYDFYIKNDFKSILNYVVFDFVSNDEFDKLNKYNFKQLSYIVHNYMMDDKQKNCSRITYYVDYPKKEYLDYYFSLYKESNATYYFIKELDVKKDSY